MCLRSMLTTLSRWKFIRITTALLVLSLPFAVFSDLSIKIVDFCYLHPRFLATMKQHWVFQQINWINRYNMAIFRKSMKLRSFFFDRWTFALPIFLTCRRLDVFCDFDISNVNLVSVHKLSVPLKCVKLMYQWCLNLISTREIEVVQKPTCMIRKIYEKIVHFRENE